MTVAPAAPAAAPALMSFTVDPWDPGYGQAFAEELDSSGGLSESSAELDLDFEVPAAEWRPVDPDPALVPPQTVLFLDGVRRIDARVWVHGGGLQPVAGIAASLAAGLVVCDELARVADVVVERGLFTAAGDAGDVVTRAGRYVAQAAEGAGLDKLSLALQQRLAFAEVQLAVAFRAAHAGDDDLLVVDGPLRGRAHLDRTVGYIKTHHASYLPGPQAAVVGALKPGQRTPAFTMGTSWERNSWYLQLPGTDGVPWSGVVRLECSPDLEPKEVTALADLTARVLPPFASTPHKDPRAPQNLVPIGGLERQLKHRLGDERLLFRALRAAAMNGGTEQRILWLTSLSHHFAIIEHMFSPGGWARKLRGRMRTKRWPSYAGPMSTVSPEERAALVALLRIRPGGMRWGEITAEVMEAGSALEIWHRLTPAKLVDVEEAPDPLREAADEITNWVDNGWMLLTILDEDYPARLRGIHQAPPVLFAQGSIVPDDRAVSVVGSRRASEQGIAIASSVARELVSRSLTVVSGLALGIDAAAHRAALASGGRTVAIIGTGINRTYPAENRELQREIAARGLLLSQFWPDAPPKQHSFPMRNATMSGYGLVTVVVEAGEHSGARGQARMAVEHGRPVILTSAVVSDNAWARNLIERPGVHVADSLRAVTALIEQVIAERDAVGAELKRLVSS